MEKIGIFYGSTMGYTKEGAELIAEEFGNDKTSLFDVSSADENDLNQFDKLIFGVSTWGLGDLQDDWNIFIEKIKKIDFSEKKVAIFGYGDQTSYPDTFVDAIGIIYNILIEKKANIIGQTKSNDYDFTNSLALKDDKFVGLALDDNNQSELTEDRIKNWVENLKENF